MNKFTLLLLVAIFYSCDSGADKTADDMSLIALGSCTKEDADFQLWAEIIESEPEIMLMLGDNIYGDSHDMSVLREKYDKQKAHPDYQAMLKNMPVVGTWDDHDYGVNDGGKNYSMKTESKIEFNRFFDLEESNPINSHEGVYNTYPFGDSRVKLIMLDTRYFRDTLAPDTLTDARYLPNLEGDVLGEDQWGWLERELSMSTASLNIIGTSIQFLSEEHGYEKWANFPAARQRMFDLLKRYPSKKVLFISGDRHISEVSQNKVEGINYPLIDFTCSGLTHSWGSPGNESNKYRLGDKVYYPNYGLIRVNWDTGEVAFEIYGRENKSLGKQTVTYTDL